MKHKSAPIQNCDKVIATIANSNETITYTFRNLKTLFIAKKLTVTISSLYLPRTNTHWFVTYNPTKGFKYKRLVKEKERMEQIQLGLKERSK